MNRHWQAIVESKRGERARLAALPFSEKVALLEAMKERSRVIRHSSVSKSAMRSTGGKSRAPSEI